MPATDHFPVCSSIQPCSKHEALTASYLGYESFCIFCYTLSFRTAARERVYFFFFYITCMLIYFSLHIHTHTQVGVEVWSVPGIFHSLGHAHPFILRLAWNSLTRLGWLVQDTRPPWGQGFISHFPIVESQAPFHTSLFHTGCK